MIPDGGAGSHDPLHVARATRESASDFLHCWVTELSPAFIDRTHTDVLSPDEVERASDFATPALAATFRACRVTLRRLLGAYCGREPSEIEFLYGHQGKPTLAPGTIGSAVQFNLSHTDGLMAIAVSREHEVGVDVERVRGDRAFLDIARQLFADDEVEALLRLDAADRAHAFHQCWARKEAYIKARGDGMDLPPHRYTVTVPPAAPRLVSVDGDGREAERWQFHDVEVGTHHVAAIAVAAPSPSPQLFHWAG